MTQVTSWSHTPTGSPQKNGSMASALTASCQAAEDDHDRQPSCASNTRLRVLRRFRRCRGGPEAAAVRRSAGAAPGRGRFGAQRGVAHEAAFDRVVVRA